jgi:hypothetical protein
MGTISCKCYHAAELVYVSESVIVYICVIVIAFVRFGVERASFC